MHIHGTSVGMFWTWCGKAASTSTELTEEFLEHFAIQLDVILTVLQELLSEKLLEYYRTSACRITSKCQRITS